MSNVRPRYPHLDRLTSLSGDDLFKVRVASNGQDREIDFATLFAVIGAGPGEDPIVGIHGNERHTEDFALASALESHLDDKDNPHEVTFAQVGAAPSSHDHTRSDITDLFSAPFWAEIPDKPADFTPSEHGNEAHDPDFLTESAFITHATDADAHKGQKNSVELDGGDLQLVGDAGSPGNNKVYGTDGSGTKGWKDDPAGGGGGDVDSVFGRTGEVVAVSGDYDFPKIDGKLAYGQLPTGDGVWDTDGGLITIQRDGSFVQLVLQRGGGGSAGAALQLENTEGNWWRLAVEGGGSGHEFTIHRESGGANRLFGIDEDFRLRLGTTSYGDAEAGGIRAVGRSHLGGTRVGDRIEFLENTGGSEPNIFTDGFPFRFGAMGPNTMQGYAAGAERFRVSGSQFEVHTNILLLASGGLNVPVTNIFMNVHTTDPGVAGQLWRSGTDLRISTG